MDSVIEILAETLLPYLELEVPVRGRDESCVKGHFGVRPHGTNRSLLQSPEELRLNLEG